MEINEFLTSFVFTQDQMAATPMLYRGPIVSEKPVKVIFDNNLNANIFYLKDCHFTAYATHNKGLFKNDDEQNIVSEHVVEDDSVVYNLFAFLEVNADNSLDNSIQVSARLPVGLKMNRILAFTESPAFSFSGLSLMLVDKKL